MNWSRILDVTNLLLLVAAATLITYGGWISDRLIFLTGIAAAIETVALNVFVAVLSPILALITWKRGRRDERVPTT